MTDIIIALFIAFAICLVLGPFVIPALRRLKFGNTEREEGVQSHLKKTGTPNMGGLMIMLGLAVAAVLFAVSANLWGRETGFAHYGGMRAAMIVLRRIPKSTKNWVASCHFAS